MCATGLFPFEVTWLFRAPNTARSIVLRRAQIFCIHGGAAEADDEGAGDPSPSGGAPPKAVPMWGTDEA